MEKEKINRHEWEVELLSTKKEYQLLLKTIVRYLKVDHDCLIFNLERAEFINIGIPSFYYDQLFQDLYKINYAINTLGIDAAKEKLIESYEYACDWIDSIDLDSD